MFWLTHSLQDTKLQQRKAGNRLLIKLPQILLTLLPRILHSPLSTLQVLSVRRDVNKLGHLSPSSIFLQQLAELSRAESLRN